MRKYMVLIAVVFGLLLAAGCGKKAKEWGPPVKATPEQIAMVSDGTVMVSPQSGKTIRKTDQTPALVYKGRLYFFSCEKSLAEFEKDPDRHALGVQSPNGMDISHTLDD